METPVIVLYHGGNCADGFCAAWLLHRAFPRATFQAVQYNQPVPDLPYKDAIIWVVDFCFPIEVMLTLCTLAKRLYLIDHHITNQPIAQHLEQSSVAVVHFSTEHSGSALTWDVLSVFGLLPEGETKENRPWVVDFTEDRDIWVWKLPNSRAVSAALATYPHNFEVWDEQSKRPASSLAAEGEAILRYQNQLVEGVLPHARSVTIEGHTVPCLNATHLISEIGSRLCQGKPFSATYFDRKDGMRVWSLRSTEDGLDVGTIAKAMGGGGHLRASGFVKPAGYFGENE